MRRWRQLAALIALDLRRWWHQPAALATALIPPLAMALLLWVLSLTVTQEPVALVALDDGPRSRRMAEIIAADTDAYRLTVTGMAEAERLLNNQSIAAIIVIPAGFDPAVTRNAAVLELTLNNIDIDFADDIRRSVDRSVGAFDGLAIEADTDDDAAPGSAPALPASDRPLGVSPYRIAVEEHDLRQTEVSFLSYQLLPLLALVLLSVGLTGTALLSARDVELGAARLLALSPTPAWLLIAGRILGGAIAALVVLAPVLGLGLACGAIALPLAHAPMLAALCVSTALSAAGMGVALGSVLTGARTVAMAASVLSTYLFFLGGGFTTIAFLPAWLRLVSRGDPLRYAIDGMRQTLFYPDLAGCGACLLALALSAGAAALIGALAARRAGRA